MCKQVVLFDGKEFATLGTQTSPNKVYQDIHWKACAWAPKQAESYTLLSVKHTDYHGAHVVTVTGYATFRVQYYKHTGDGMYPVVAPDILSWWKETPCADTAPNPDGVGRQAIQPTTSSLTTTKKKT
jgi:hypothetical protein